LGMKEYHGRYSFHEKVMGTLVRWYKSRRPRKSTGIGKKADLCYHCNHDILGPFEERVQPILSQMILGEMVTLNRDQQLLIAAWITKFSIIASLVDAENKTEVFRLDERKSFIDTLMPIESSWIWIARFESSTGRDATLAHTFGLLAFPQGPY